nr:hypothetical protein pJBCL41_00168 [Pseudomonas sp.]
MRRGYYCAHGEESGKSLLPSEKQGRAGDQEDCHHSEVKILRLDFHVQARRWMVSIGDRGRCQTERTNSLEQPT